jgi:hypothetical protein
MYVAEKIFGVTVSHTNTYDAETLVGQDSVVADEVAAPIWSSVSDLLCHAQGSGLKLRNIRLTGGKKLSVQIRVDGGATQKCPTKGH